MRVRLLTAGVTAACWQPCMPHRAHVQQGDGTAAICAGDARIFTLSVHGESNFPARKQRSSLDVGLPDGTADGEYLAIVAEVWRWHCCSKLHVQSPRVYNASAAGWCCICLTLLLPPLPSPGADKRAEILSARAGAVRRRRGRAH